MKMYLITSTPSLQLSGAMHSSWRLHQKKKRKERKKKTLGKWNSLKRKVLQILTKSLGIMKGLFVTPWTVALQAPLSMGFPRQEY